MDEKSTSPLFPVGVSVCVCGGGGGAVVTNEWCISHSNLSSKKHFYRFMYAKSVVLCLNMCTCFGDTGVYKNLFLMRISMIYT